MYYSLSLSLSLSKESFNTLKAMLFFYLVNENDGVPLPLASFTPSFFPTDFRASS